VYKEGRLLSKWQRGGRGIKREEKKKEKELMLLIPKEMP